MNEPVDVGVDRGPRGMFQPGERDLSEPCDVGDEVVGEMMGRPIVQCRAHDYPAYEGEDQCLMGALGEEDDVEEAGVL